MSLPQTPPSRQTVIGLLGGAHETDSIGDIMPKAKKPPMKPARLILKESTEEGMCCYLHYVVNDTIIEYHLSPDAARALGERMIYQADKDQDRSNFN